MIAALEALRHPKSASADENVGFGENLVNM